jgi:hypothetical protein
LFVIIVFVVSHFSLVSFSIPLVASLRQKQLLGEYNEGGRGLELSELIHFDGRLLTCDDRTGISMRGIGVV